MLTLVKLFALAGLLWAAAALTFQALTARGGGRKDFSNRSGDGRKGVAYIFTVAMMPAHKESVKRHPVKFAIGLLLHFGVLLAMLGTVLLLLSEIGENLLSIAWPLMAVSLLAGVYLFFRRLFSQNLRAMSTADDFAAILASCGLLLAALLHAFDIIGQAAFLLYGGALFIYLPLGKLRHALFFFVARGDYGRRLGYRGVYPPAFVNSKEPDLGKG